MVEATAGMYEKAANALQAGHIEACGALLSKLKIALLDLSFLPTESGMTDKEFVLARSILELGAQWSLKTADPASERIAAFGRFFAQLKPYYFDYRWGLLILHAHRMICFAWRRTTVPDSAYRFQLMGANLLCLLAQNRIAQFHMELETLEPAVLENVYIRHPVQLEQHLMEGAYNKVVLAKNNVPAENYAFFMTVLVDTIRGEIADCCQASYTQLSVAEAQRLMFADAAALSALANERGWAVGNSHVMFPAAEKIATALPSAKVFFNGGKVSLLVADRAASFAQLIERTLHYARELEKIV